MAKQSQPQKILRVVVTGGFSSGKSTLIHAIDEKRLKFLNRYETEDDDIAIDLGIIPFEANNINTNELHLLSTPNSRQFNSMWLILEKGLMGFIGVVDSSVPETFRESHSIIETFTAYAPVPYVIAANKQDLDTAWDVDALRIALRIPREIPLVHCIATDKKSVANVLIVLCETILKAIEAEEQINSD